MTMTFNKEQRISPDGKKSSLHVYLLESGKTVEIAPKGKGRPPLKRPIEGQVGTLVKVIQFGPAPRAVAPVAAPEPKGEVKRKTVNNAPIKQTVLVYADGSKVVATGGRPKLVNSEGSPLVLVESHVPGKGTKGRDPVPTVVVEVTENPGIAYVYGGVESRKPAGKRGAPAALKDGKSLEKIIRYVLAEGAVVAPVEGEDKPAEPTMAELGWSLGDKVTLKGSTKVAEVVSVGEYHIGVRYPGDKFIDTFPVSKLLKVA